MGAVHDAWFRFHESLRHSQFSDSQSGGFRNALSIPTLANTIWLTDETRVDRDQAAFAQVTWDITSHLSLNGGLRYYTYDNTLQGFFGYSRAYSHATRASVTVLRPGLDARSPPARTSNNRVTGSGNVPRANLTYKFMPDKLVYATSPRASVRAASTAPRKPGIGPYQTDFLKNYEIGWKTQWFDHSLRWNGAVFWEDWNNFQFSFLGLNSVTIIENGGNARIKGIENEFEWAATSNLTLSTSFTFLDPRLTENYCGICRRDAIARLR